MGRNGEITKQRVVQLDESALDRLETHDSEIRRVCEQVDLRELTYLSDGLRVKGYLATPRKGEGLPCLIFNRGGQGEFGALNDLSAVMLLSRQAARGMVVVASQYRGCAGEEGSDEFGGRDVADVCNLFPLLDGLERADSERVGMWGISRGCMMTYRVLALTDRVSAAICWSGLSDLAAGLRERGEDMEALLNARIPHFVERREAAIRERSAVQWAEMLCKDTPILLVHGAKDERSAPDTQGIAMAQALYACGHPFRFVLLEGADHGLRPHTVEADGMLHTWFDRHVRSRAHP